MDTATMPDFSALPGWMPAASMGIGGLSDLFAIIQNQRTSNRQRALYDLLQNPQALAAHMNAMYQPLSQSGQQAISRNVQADMAMRGTANSGLADLEAARAFSENETQRRNAIMESYMNALGQSAGLTGTRAPIGGLSNAMQQVMLMRAIKGGQPKQPGISDYNMAPTVGANPYGTALQAQQWGAQPTYGEGL